MLKNILALLIILLVAVSNVFFAGCSTAHSRRREQRIEDLERRVSRIEFDFKDSSSPDDDLSKYRDMAKSAR